VSEAPTCDRCGRPVVDSSYVCTDCVRPVRRDLETVAKVAGEAATTVAKLDRIGHGSRRSDPDPPLPVNLEAGEDHDAAVNVLTTWARHVHESSGRALPAVDGQHPLAVLATWLVDQLDWLRHRREATEAVEGLSEACRILVRVVDRPPERIVVGQCPCGEYLYAIRAAPAVTCRSCGASYDVDATRAMLRRQLGQTLMTAAEIATLATYLGLTGSRGTTRKLINQWASRGLIAAHGSYHVDDEDQADEDGVAGLFRFGDVIERLAVSRRRVDHGPATVTGV
jgi:hypothetical protein